MKALVLIAILLGIVSCRPQLGTFVVSRSDYDKGVPAIPRFRRQAPTVATISKLHIESVIQFRYAKTVVQSFMKNPSTSDAQEVHFELVLPEKAFISNFTIETGIRLT